ncbi:DUF3991 and toprim domain-containing protein [Mesorhizobium sp. M4A.F.Ca.ET.050.02.1.1]|uniref:DUF3991 and toprim domain-containing protein n=1 Tax=Mesorhizobium sp. M4A.F.Ca.ET.050.02.1.1 TaxID=2496754 RepID=UPI001FE17B7F|nr:DUF3991 and toprim domain-containing protein [Mesorhizobium sp. M4A.F.Ca.ET.050.02.1.1]
MSDVEELRSGVLCAAVLERAGFAVDQKESTRRAVKFRRGAEIIIVIHDGKGWFDPLSEAKGDVFHLVEHLEGVRFVEALDHVANLIGFVSRYPILMRAPQKHHPDRSVSERWRSRRQPGRGSMSWSYLRGKRRLPETVIRTAVRQDRLREGPCGSMWAAHTDEAGALTGWEERGPEWRGFASGGAKLLFRLGAVEATRFCVTEAAIDAMSLAAIEELRPGSLYLSTGGGWAPATVAAIRGLAARNGALLVAATDNNTQGDVYAGRLEAVAVEAGCGFERLRPVADDWNEDLHARKL